jgi:hypothetical protein
MCKKIVYVFVFIIILLAQTVAQGAEGKKLDYTIKEFFNEEKAEYHFNKFYPIHYIYINIFFAFDLHDSFTYEQKKDIIKKIKAIISKNNMTEFRITNFKDNKDLILTYTPDHPPKYPNETVIWFISNYDFNKNKIVSGDNMKNAYATFYYVKGDALIKYQYEYSTEKEEELINEDNINNLADYYIYDDNPDNDEKAKQLLNECINETADVNRRFVCMLTLTEYYFLRNDLKEVKKIIGELKLLLPQLDEKRAENYRLYYDATNELYQMMLEID